MARITVEDCLAQIPNRFELVVVAAHRAKELLKGSPRLVDSDNKEVVTALREVAAGKVWKEGEDDAVQHRANDRAKNEFAGYGTGSLDTSTSSSRRTSSKHGDGDRRHETREEREARTGKPDNRYGH